MHKFMPQVATAEDEDTGAPSSNSGGESGDHDDLIDTSEDLDIADAEAIGLPSDYSKDELEQLGLMTEAREEMLIREAELFTDLALVRGGVEYNASFLVEKKTGGRHGQKVGTRLNNEIRKSRDYSSRLAERYNNSHERLKCLRAALEHQPQEGSPEARLRKIRPEDLATGALTTGPQKGESKATLSWIWRILEPSPKLHKQPARQGKSRQDSGAHNEGSEQGEGAAVAAWRESGTWQTSDTFLLR